MIRKSFKCFPKKAQPGLNTLCSSWPRAPILSDANIETFRAAVERSTPTLLPRRTFLSIPAIHRWFDGSALRWSYLEPYGKILVPLELTTPDEFYRASAPLSILTSFIRDADKHTKARFYLAQTPLQLLPEALANDLPLPNLLQPDTDIYDTSLWLGRSPTSTALHRDPNPNLLVQLAGEKRIRILPPKTGDELFQRVKTTIPQEVSTQAGVRGREMMIGAEKDMLEVAIWEAKHFPDGLEATLNTGDGIFIPPGWWHSIKGVGDGVTASVNWWFRLKQVVV